MRVTTKPRKAPIKKDQNGFTLAGVVVLLLLGVGLICGGISILQERAKKEEDKNFIHGLNNINVVSDKAYFDKYSYGRTGDDLTSRFLKLNAFESPIEVIGGKPYTPYEIRSPISVNVLNHGGTNGHFLIVSFGNIDRETCLNLIEMNGESYYDSVGIEDVNPYEDKGKTENNPTYEIADKNCTESNTMKYLIKSR